MLGRRQPPGGLPRPPRQFAADAVLSGAVDLRSYPFRMICVTSATRVVGSVFGGRGAVLNLIDVTMSAVELLESQGWELINFEQGGLTAYLRRGPG
jgi:hypothetical protein